MRQTRQRAAILRALQDTDQHPNAEWVFAEVRKEIPRVSLGTVYRLLHTLAGEGAVGVLTTDGGPHRYDGRPGPHQHIVCTACGRIRDVPEFLSPDVTPVIERWTGYAVSHAQLNWYGLCPDCRAAARKNETA